MMRAFRRVGGLLLLAGILLALSACAEEPAQPAEGRWEIDRKATLETVADEEEYEATAIALDMMEGVQLEVDSNAIRIAGFPGEQQALALEQLGECISGTRVDYDPRAERLSLAECGEAAEQLDPTRLVFRRIPGGPGTPQ